MKPIVSILIPAYNAENWIKDTINSALSQTWPKKEIIIVDDGSSDNTFRIAKKFESRTIKVVTQQNMGACCARNKAFSLSQGDYIQWLDADDLLAPDKISTQLKERYNDSDGMTLLTSAFGFFFFCRGRAKFRSNSLWQDLAPVDWIVIKFTEGVWMNPATWLVSRRLTEIAGLWDERLSLDDDGEYMCRLVARSEKIRFVAEARCYYRVGNAASLSRRKSDKTLSNFFLSICLSVEHLLSLENSERTRLACLKFLEDSLWNFYPEEVEIINKARELARNLGGELSLSSERIKFLIARKLFGWKNAKKMKNISHEVKTAALRGWDKLIYVLTNDR